MRCEWRTDDPPEEKDYYLITNSYGDLEVACWTNVPLISIGTVTGWRWMCKSQYIEVKAWMPLPAPYDKDLIHVKHGRWKDSLFSFFCSECGHEEDKYQTYTPDDYKYCPNCGAKMDLK